jgi:hypothetical protein
VRNTSTDRISTLLLTNALSVSAHDCTGDVNQPSNMGWHSNVIAVDPTNRERVWAAGVDLYRSDNGGRTWRLASYWWADVTTPSYVHADLHGIVFDPRYDGKTNQTLFVTTDGGVFATNNAAASILANGVDNGACDAAASLLRFQSLNHGFTATQFYSGLALPDGKSWFGGAQDNGTPLGTSTGGPDSWVSVLPGDGGYVAIGPTVLSIPPTICAEFQYAMISCSPEGQGFWEQANVGLNDDFLFVTPYAFDRGHTDGLWTGGRRLWHSEVSGFRWQIASAPGQFPGQVSAIAVDPNNFDHVVAGTSSGAIVRNDSATSANALTPWPMATPRDGFVSSLTFTDANTVYATYALFGGGPHLWRSTDGGTTWTAIGTDLPDMPLHSLASYGDRLFLGTDLGVFVSFDGGTSWAADTGFPAVITESVSVGQGASGPALYAFTHGRGAWRAELTAPVKRRAVGR